MERSIAPSSCRSVGSPHWSSLGELPSGSLDAVHRSRFVERVSWCRMRKRIFEGCGSVVESKIDQQSYQSWSHPQQEEESMMFILFYQIILQTILNMAAAISARCACVYTISCSAPTAGRRNSRLNSRISRAAPLVMAKVFGGVRVMVISCSARGSCGGVCRFLRRPGAIGPTAHFSKMIWLFAALTAIRTTICTSLLDMENHSLALFCNFRRVSENPTSITIVGK